MLTNKKTSQGSLSWINENTVWSEVPSKWIYFINFAMNLRLRTKLKWVRLVTSNKYKLAMDRKWTYKFSVTNSSILYYMDRTWSSKL